MSVVTVPTIDPAVITPAPTTSTPTDIDTSTGDHDKFTHIVADAEAVAFKIMESRLTGQPLTALCGKVWVPSDNPKKYPLCGTCKDIAIKRGWKIPS